MTSFGSSLPRTSRVVSLVSCVSSVTAIYTLLGGSLVLPTPQTHPPLVAPRSVASSYCTISLTQVGLGIDVMQVGLFGFCPWLFKAAYRPLSLLYFGFHYGFSGNSFVPGWNTAEVFLLLPPHLFDLFLYFRFG